MVVGGVVVVCGVVVVGGVVVVIGVVVVGGVPVPVHGVVVVSTVVVVGGVVVVPVGNQNNSYEQCVQFWNRFAACICLRLTLF